MPHSFLRRTLPVVVASALALGQHSKLAHDEVIYTVSDYRPEVTFTTSSSLLQVEAVVRDSSHNPVDGLNQDDFALSADGKPQRITGFDIERRAPAAASGAADSATHDAAVPATANPRSVTLFIDDVGTTLDELNNLRNGALHYLDSNPPSGESFAVSTASGVVGQDFTSDRTLVKAALNRIAFHPRTGCNASQTFIAYQLELYGRVQVREQRGPAALGVASAAAGAAGPCDGDGPGGVTAAGEIQARVVYEGILTQLQYLVSQPGERVLLLASYGIFSLDQGVFGEQIEHISDLAIRNHITINTLDTEGVGDVLVNSPDLDSMAKFSRDTGGQLFYGDNGFAQGIKELVQPAPVKYILSFQPMPSPSDGKMHPIDVVLTRRRGLDVAARDEYLAPPPADTGIDQLREKIRKAVLADTTPTDLPADALVTARAAAGIGLTFQLHTQTLPLTLIAGRRDNTVLAVAELFDRQGHQVSGQLGHMRLSLKDDTAKGFAKPGNTVALSLTLHVPAGSYRLRTVVGEAQTGRLSASNTDVVVP